MDQKQEKTPKEAKTNIVVEACSCQREEGMITEVCSDALNSSPFLENLNSVNNACSDSQEHCTGLMAVITHSVAPA